ncbi:hypothetical protein NDU88_005346 [Pleurodeles waltl]|uniref:Uncharacterized protein n=1 Tax=Pleurodeles waltl TaxID=8319 RepID=A0AAV7QHK9_PLEWA|nr:hypothetical protein NDU88_005346 [Pleurodeles waltl]
MLIPSPASAPGVPQGKKSRKQETRISKDMKREEGQRARGERAEEDEEEKDAGMEEESGTGEDAGKSILDVREEEPHNDRLLSSRGDPTEGQGGPERQQLCHVPGGAWLQQVAV